MTTFITVAVLCASSAYTIADEAAPVAAPPVVRIFILAAPAEREWNAIASRPDVAVLGAYALAQEGALVDDGAMVHVPGLRNLKTLMLESSQITDRGLAHIVRATSLEAILLYGCKVSDDGLQQLSALPKLKTLGLYETHVTRGGVDRFLQKRPEVDLEVWSVHTTGRIFDGNGCPATPFRKRHVDLPGILRGW